jgi:methylenetetrahydrofolate--tRNA-(uracil-5-)-methyltransferase
MENIVNVIGAGLAGCECAYILAQNGIKVKLYEMKPKYKSDAHKSNCFAELVCSNSLKSEALTNACGLLKKEMNILGSVFVEAAYNSRVPAGQALAVDRDIFSKYITEKINENKNIEVISEKIDDIDKLNGIKVIATGPLTDSKLMENLQTKLGDNSLYFYDAAAPIVSRESINMNIAYWGDRYEQERGKEESIEDWKERISKTPEADYLNLPMNKEEYEEFCTQLVNAEVVTLHEFEKKEIFEGCMPIEVMAKRGIDTLRFGPLKPVGFTDPRTGRRPYANVQLRMENAEGQLFNLVGFQTNLKFGEQKRVFSIIPGLENAVFERYGVMHKNTYINGGKLLDSNFCLKKDNDIYFAGQISGVEGYVESAASGMMVAYSIIARMNGRKITFPEDTILGSLAKYVSTENKNYQPMNANFGILKPLDKKIRDKKEKYSILADIAIESITKFKEENLK